MTDGKLVDKFLRAAKCFDWGQPAFHQGIPCFYLDRDGRFCGRAQSWDGHDEDHAFIPLYRAIDAWAQKKVDEALERAIKAVCGSCNAESPLVENISRDGWTHRKGEKILPCWAHAIHSMKSKGA